MGTRLMPGKGTLARARASVRQIPLPSLRLRVSERKLLLCAGDLAALWGALVAALLLRAALAPAAAAVSSVGGVLAHGTWFVTLGVWWAVWALFLDVYNLARAADAASSARRAGLAAAIALAAYTLTPFVTPPLQSRALIAAYASLGVTGVAAWRGAYARVFVQPQFKQRALVVGAGRAGRRLGEALRQAAVRSQADGNPFRGTGYRLIGFVDDAPALQGTAIGGVPVRGGSGDLARLARELAIDELVVAITHHDAIDEALCEALIDCCELGLRVTPMSALYERLLGRVPVDCLGRDLCALLQARESAWGRLYAALKRLADLCLGAAGLAVLGTLLPVVALANALTSPGSLFYRQARVGRGGQPFTMVKLRTMRPDAERESGAVWAAHEDGRATPLGRWLRRTRLDELPQCINVLRGEMSVIGPRPERPEFVDQLAAQIPFYRVRHAVKPGITGWAQLQYHYGASVDDAQVKLEYDLYYIKYAGPYLDLCVLLRTLPVMLRMEG